jgi:indolepyruvate ferredoxin oxidoreductase alpha subunit
MTTKILLGDEAVALGAVHAGLAVGYSYPGTPASEVMEYLIRISKQKTGFRAKWCVNEKVAYEEALGVSFSGKRTMVSMKHVGLNVAADPFMNSALTTIMGGLVVVVADDPGMHSSQNEQDSRYYSQFAHIICFEPSDHQEAYDMTRHAFDVSEKWNIPVMIRLVTRLSHSRSRVKTQPPGKESKCERGKDQDWTLLPVNARRSFKALVEKQKEFVKLSEESRFNSLVLNKKNHSLGIIASGIGYNYVKENIEDKAEAPSILKISTYPLPQAQLSQLVEHADTILIIEEGYPFIERQLRGLFGIKGKSIQGKLSGHLPSTGELQPDIVRKAMNMEPRSRQPKPEIKLAGRPPQLCKGCPHADTVTALNQVLESYPDAVVFSDIGCYTLAALPPYNAVDTCVCMGASVSMAKGGAEAGVFPSVGMIGDSTFAHSGITPLVDAAAANTNMTLIIVDNASVAMTGGQPSFLSGDKLLRMIEGAGVDKKHIRVLIPLPKNLAENKGILREEIEHQGLSVIVASRDCVQEVRKKKKKGAK